MSEDDIGDHDSMVIDCGTCAVRGVGCGDCVVTVLLGAPPDGAEIDAEERRALDALAAGGLVPPLRMVSGVAATEPKRLSG